MAAYVIQPGDNPMGIARRFGMSFDAFKAFNPGLCDANNNCRILFPGQVVQVVHPEAHLPLRRIRPSLPQVSRHRLHHGWR